MSVFWKTSARKRRVLLFILLLGISLPQPSTVSAQVEGPIYIVQEGDTLSEIAYTFGIDLDVLVQANGIEDPSRLFPGQQLVLPGYEGVRGFLQTVTVQLGDNLRSLSDQYKLPVEALRKLNRIVNPGRMYLGQAFIVATQETPDEANLASLIVPSGLSILEIAVLQDENPWTVCLWGDQGSRMWAVPGEGVLTNGEIQFDAPVTLPFNLILEPEIQVQGTTLEIQIHDTTTIPLEGRIGDRELHFQATLDQGIVALQGIHALQPPGLMELEILGSEDASTGKSTLFSQPIQVVEGGYGLEALRVPPETIDPEQTGPEDALVRDLLSDVSPERLWEGVFQFPASYYETFPSIFGTRRSYNQSEYDYYHTGLDLYGSTSTPILAPARGRVVFSDFLVVRGNATYIDHGWGVFTGYLHQSQILVEDGDTVEPGQIIGYVGGTGRVTGPHLHWEIWVGGVPVNPIQWTEKAFP
jgi:murein DD-endopeptidase MepM/ murein hydrolase activator NlpD